MNVLLLKRMYIFVILESQVIAHHVKPGFVTFVEYAYFRIVNVAILGLCPVFQLRQWMPYSHRCHPQFVPRQ